jgi:hypothetical protein
MESLFRKCGLKNVKVKQNCEYIFLQFMYFLAVNCVVHILACLVAGTWPRLHVHFFSQIVFKPGETGHSLHVADFPSAWATQQHLKCYSDLAKQFAQRYTCLCR